MQELDADCVLGNHDRALLQGLDIPCSRSGTLAIRDQAARARPGTRSFLAALPEARELTIGGTELLLVHGSPRQPLDERLTALDDELIASSPGVCS